MHTASPLPSTGEVFADARGGDRELRVSWHAEAGVVVLSLWRAGTCSGTFRLPVDAVPDLVDVLRTGVSDAYELHRTVLDQMLDGDTDHLAG